MRFADEQGSLRWQEEATERIDNMVLQPQLPRTPYGDQNCFPATEQAGVCFLCASKSGAHVQVSETEEEVARLQGQVTTVQEKMRELKGRLSLKFGSNINLEEED